jgi:2-(1,2-epoxy-1,2-dihydrophenyl)acetyl-CoA isomerase
MQQGTFRGFEVGLQGRGIAVVTMNQPERLNGMTQGMKRDMIEILTEAQMDQAVRVVVITGSGRAFSAGDDISGRPRSNTGATAIMPDIPAGHDSPMGTYEGLRVLSQTLNLAVRNLDKISIAAVNGGDPDGALAGAVVRLRTARRGPVGSDAAPLMPTRAALLPYIRWAWQRRWTWMRTDRERSEAAELGWCTRVLPTVMERAMALAAEMADGPQVAMRLLKRSVHNAAEQTFAHALDDIAAKTAISDHHADAREGIRAFQEKRKAEFS